MKTEIDKLNDRIDFLLKIINDMSEVDIIQSERIDTANKRIDVLNKRLGS